MKNNQMKPRSNLDRVFIFFAGSIACITDRLIN